MDQIQKWTNKFIFHVFLSLLISFIGCVLGVLFLPVSFARVCSWVLIIVLIFTAMLKRENKLPMWFGYIFFFVDGITISPTIIYYIGSEGISYVLSVFALTIVISGVLALCGYLSKKDLSSWGGALFGVLIALLLVGIVNLFLNSGIMSLVLSIIGAALFSLYLIYDMNKLKRFILAGKILETNDLTWHVMNVYLDIINLFLRLLRLFRK